MGLFSFVSSSVQKLEPKNTVLGTSQKTVFLGSNFWTELDTKIKSPDHEHNIFVIRA
jgi:hypothetical protein